jgi:hypothetical protein
VDEFFICAFCFQKNSVFVDPSGGENQRYVEDCQICCQPNKLSIWWDELEECYSIDSEPES